MDFGRSERSLLSKVFTTGKRLQERGRVLQRSKSQLELISELLLMSKQAKKGTRTNSEEVRLLNDQNRNQD